MTCLDAPPQAWATTAAEAFFLMVDAQPESTPWRQLLSQASQHRQLVAAKASSAAESGMSARQAPNAVVVAGVVLSVLAPASRPPANPVHARRYLCVSLGSGTRCVGVSPTDTGDARASPDLDPFVIRDGHAEVLARRGFNAALLSWMAKLASEVPPPPATPPPEVMLLLRFTPGAGRFSLREDLRVTLVTTHWPCGSLALAATGETGGRLLLQTPLATLHGWRRGSAGDGALSQSPVIGVRNHQLAAHRSPEDVDPNFANGARVKPGKGHCNLNMSCSDKLWRWAVRGVLPQGMHFLFGGPLPLRVSELSVGQPRSLASAGDAKHKETVEHDEVLRATASLLAKSRCLSLGDSVGKCNVVPTVSLFSLPSPLHAKREPVRDAVKGDSGFSRCAWMTTLPHVEVVAGGSGKRSREAATGPCRTHFAQLTLNMKDGLPQGMSRSTLQRKASQLQTEETRYSELAALFPLTEAWFAREASRLPVGAEENSPRAKVPMAVWLRDAHATDRSGDGDGERPSQSMLWTYKPT